MAKYSIVVPFHNEEENVTILYARLKQVMEQVGDAFELVLVDDGSTDRTYKLLEEIAAVDSRVLVVKLRRNFGQTSALSAGFDHASGEFLLAMDGDLQHDPNDIPAFLEKLDEGYDVVSGWRKTRIDNFFLRRIPSACANWIMARLSGVPIHDFGTTFKAYRREVIQSIPLYGELHRFIPALASWYGATICEIPIRNVNRERGKSHYGLGRTFRVFFDLMTIRFLLRYMSRPLHFFGGFGILGMFTGSIMAAVLLGIKLAPSADEPDGSSRPHVRHRLGADRRRHSVAGPRPARRIAGAPLLHQPAPRILHRRSPGSPRLRRRAEPALRAPGRHVVKQGIGSSQ